MGIVNVCPFSAIHTLCVSINEWSTSANMFKYVHAVVTHDVSCWLLATGMCSGANSSQVVCWPLLTKSNLYLQFLAGSVWTMDTRDAVVVLAHVQRLARDCVVYRIYLNHRKTSQIILGWRNNSALMKISLTRGRTDVAFAAFYSSRAVTQEFVDQ